jgi:antitoxin component YwqK of YwqJK toxin-antitoxin module
VFYKDGVRHGTWKEFFENGELKLSATFVKGKMEGEYATYYLGKKVAKKGQYVNGKQDGVWLTYNLKGLRTIYQKYNKGFLELERRFEEGKMVYEIDNLKNTVIDLRQKKEEEGEEK